LAAAALATVALVLGAAVVATAGGVRNPNVVCAFDASDGRLSVRIRDERPRLDLRGIPPRIREEIERSLRDVQVPSTATIERRADDVTVLRGFLGSPVGCRGPAPSVEGAAAIRVRTGKHTNSAELVLDLVHGELEPGLPHEGDGSEIEIDARIGLGDLYARATRGPDHVAIGAVSGLTAINFNAAEALPDHDLTLGRKSPLFVAAAGGDDTVTASTSAGVAGGRVFGLAYIDGGQGADRLDGGAGGQFLSGGSGADRVAAGGGSDFVLAFGHAADRIDCGSGRDFAVVSNERHQLHDCERTERGRDFFTFERSAMDRPVEARLRRLRALHLLVRHRVTARRG
jgi:hypothetical protein